MLRLYHVPLCPYSRKIRVALREKQLVCELVEVQPWLMEDWFVELNPAAEAPVLVDGDLVICDSRAIEEYLEEAYPQISLFGRTIAERAETRRLVAWFDSKFAREVSDPLWREKVVKRWKRAGFPSSEALRRGAEAIRLHLAYIDWLYQERKWLAGDFFTMADIAAAAHLSVLDYLGDVPWAEAQGAREWYAKMKSRPSFRPILLERIVGINPPAHYDDPDF
ncbi:MAG: glutathione S-transferase family protein [Geminicoccaceae bacterium]|nr:glutathione S-transferase family protein [Geminicoccaceae bacterium]MCS7269078.1 glutathione S-transferase family protein [Geminicoccaceae bacterium]MCX7630751.1 glutathione S-transferase family protein [Geminicoccaceae bacterium]MDW8125813.1 glutathione S-transferase family protein [Geminicoccaceae bacterium]MDW8342701.1 glutathione S-transferase family protein [Geminicoccaceae bacterium]